MNSRNLSRFHKFSSSNFKKKITEIKNSTPIVSAQFVDLDPEKNLKNIKIKKINSTLNYKLSSSPFPFFWVVNTEATLLFSSCLFITVKRNWAESPKKDSRLNSQKKSPNHCLGSRPRVDVATWILFICSSLIVTMFL